jgi:hypothetical protein
LLYTCVAFQEVSCIISTFTRTILLRQIYHIFQIFPPSPPLWLIHIYTYVITYIPYIHISLVRLTHLQYKTSCASSLWFIRQCHETSTKYITEKGLAPETCTIIQW